MNVKAGHSRGLNDTLEVQKPDVIIEGQWVGVRQVLPEIEGTVIVASKKAEAIMPSPADANLALNNTRQLFARVAGVMVWENDGSGVQAGIAVRGLSPNRSWEFNTRMDGADIAADIAGYPEAYFTPSFESLERVVVVRGAASLQYGAQFGGLLDYITKSAPTNKALSFESSQLGGSQGYYSTYTALGSSNGRWSYYVFGNYRRSNGWRQPLITRDGSQQETDSYWQYSVMPKVEYHLNDATTLRAHVSLMQYHLQQPGGLDSSQYAINSQQAVRYRDWFGITWLAPSLTLDHRWGDNAQLTAKLFGVVGDRESIGLTTNPMIADTGTNPRRVNTDNYRNAGLEIRARVGVPSFGWVSPLGVGIRLYRGLTIRKQGRGPDGEAYSTEFIRPLTRDLEFVTFNAAAFAEWNLHVAENLSITPGFRLEVLRMNGNGYYSLEQSASSPDAFAPAGPQISFEKTSNEVIPLAGVGVVWKATSTLELYGNAHQSWRPAQFSELFPSDPVTAVDPTLRSMRGVSTDVGVRGTVAGCINIDVSGFYLYYGDRIGTVNRSALGADTILPGGASQLRQNLGASEHTGVELYAEYFLGRSLPLGEHDVSMFISGSYTDARYSAGPTAGKRVEYAPEWILRAGVRYQWSTRVGLSLQRSYVSECFSDAANTISTASGINGIIPAYTVWDCSVVVGLTQWLRAELSINNIFDVRYFTRRAGGYPGPGIIPADGRIVTGGIRVML